MIKINDEMKVFVEKIIFPIVFGAVLFIIIHTIFDILHIRPFRAPDYGVITSVTALILTIMFPMAVVLKEKKDKEDKKYGAMIGMKTELDKDICSREVYIEEFSIVVWRIFFNIVTILPAIFSITLFFLWGGHHMFERGQYIVALHLIIFSILMSAFFALYDMEWEFTFWNRIYLRRSWRRNRRKFDNIMEHIKVSKSVISIEKMENLSRDSHGWQVCVRIVSYSIFCATFSAIPVLWKFYIYTFTSFPRPSFLSFLSVIFRINLVYLAIFILANIFIFSFGLLSFRIDYNFFPKFFMCTVLMVTISSFSFLLIRDNFKYLMGLTLSLTSIVFILLGMIFSYKLKTFQYNRIKELVSNISKNVTTYEAAEIESFPVNKFNKIENYFVDKLNIIISRNMEYEEKCCLE